MTLRAAAVTMMRDDPFFLRIWHQYYSRQLGDDHLYVIDNGSVWPDGMPSEIQDILARVSVVKIPFQDGVGRLQKRGFDYTRFSFINAFIAGLRSYYNIVLHNDIDELFVPDPARWSGLHDYLADEARRGGVVSGVGIELFQDVESDAAYDPAMPLFAQRPNYIYRVEYCKPHLFYSTDWVLPHKATKPFFLDPDLYLVHLKYLDADRIVARQDDILDYYDKGMGGRRSRWSWSQQRLKNEFDKLAKRDTYDGAAFQHTELFERDLPKRDARYLINVPRDDGYYSVARAITEDSFFALQDFRRRLPASFVDSGI